MATRANIQIDESEAKAPRGWENQPVARISWVDPSELHSNSYNPNRVAPPELRLLKISIMSDGWTQPIVARSDGEIVDGFHRWCVSQDPEVRELTGGLAPVVFLDDSLSPEHQKMSTIRHNRARGAHYVVAMADIVRDLHFQGGMTPEEISRYLQMDPEEVDRLLTRGRMADRYAHAEVNEAYAFVPKDQVPEGARVRQNSTDWD